MAFYSLSECNSPSNPPKSKDHIVEGWNKFSGIITTDYASEMEFWSARNARGIRNAQCVQHACTRVHERLSTHASTLTWAHMLEHTCLHLGMGEHPEALALQGACSWVRTLQGIYSLRHAHSLVHSPWHPCALGAQPLVRMLLGTGCLSRRCTFLSAHSVTSKHVLLDARS